MKKSTSKAFKTLKNHLTNKIMPEFNEAIKAAESREANDDLFFDEK